MRWDHVLTAISAVAAGDLVLDAIYDGSVRMAGSGDHRTPLLEYSLIGDAETELWEPMTVQFDMWNDELEDRVAAERRLRQLFSLDVPGEIGGILMFAEYQGGEMLASPDRDGYFGRAVRFRFTPTREQYMQPTP